jgi:hypothetical protein
MNMNKRAKKRLKETIEKDNVEKAKARQGQGVAPNTKGLKNQQGFLPKPAKKRG